MSECFTVGVLIRISLECVSKIVRREELKSSSVNGIHLLGNFKFNFSLLFAKCSG